MKFSRIYFAHPITDYGTPFENEALAFMAARFPGCEVVNPNRPEHTAGYKRSGMVYFYEEVLPSCDACAFLAFDNGMIGAGVAGEISWFEERGLPVWELFSRNGARPAHAIHGNTLEGAVDRLRVLSVDETRTYIKKIRAAREGV